MGLRLSMIAAALAFACGGSPPPPTQPAPSAPPPAPEPIPEPTPSPGPELGGQCAGPPPGPGYECVQNCGPPVSQEGDPPPGYSWLSAEDAGKRKQFGCPICLPDDARIATPSGSMAVSKLTPGALVWSLDQNGRRVAARVLHVLSTPVPNGHTLAVVELADGRVVRASPGHPGPDGRALGSLSAGDILDGSVVVRTRRIPYRGRTYDLVLDHARVHYVSDGVVVKSSLAR